MSGRQEKEMQLERAIKIKLQDAPAILEEYYYCFENVGCLLRKMILLIGAVKPMRIRAT